MLLLVIALGLAVALASALYLLADDATRTELRKESFKYVLQFIVVVLLGTTATFLYNNVRDGVQVAREEAANVEEEQRVQAEKEIEKVKERHELLRAYATRLGDVYRAVKETRRALRSVGLTSTYGRDPDELSNEQLGEYDQQMAIINEAQQHLEALRIEIEHFSFMRTESDTSRPLRANLHKMERYLSEIVTESEEHLPLKPVMHGHLPQLKDFTRDVSQDTRRTAPNTFREEFGDPLTKGLELLAQREPSQPD